MGSFANLVIPLVIDIVLIGGVWWFLSTESGVPLTLVRSRLPTSCWPLRLPPSSASHGRRSVPYESGAPSDGQAPPRLSTRHSSKVLALGLLTRPARKSSQVL